MADKSTLGMLKDILTEAESGTPPLELLREVIQGLERKERKERERYHRWHDWKIYTDSHPPVVRSKETPKNIEFMRGTTPMKYFYEYFYDEASAFGDGSVTLKPDWKLAKGGLYGTKTPPS